MDYFFASFFYIFFSQKCLLRSKKTLKRMEAKKKKGKVLFKKVLREKMGEKGRNFHSCCIIPFVLLLLMLGLLDGFIVVGFSMAFKDQRRFINCLTLTISLFFFYFPKSFLLTSSLIRLRACFLVRRVSE